MTFVSLGFGSELPIFGLKIGLGFRRTSHFEAIGLFSAVGKCNCLRLCSVKQIKISFNSSFGKHCFGKQGVEIGFYCRSSGS